MSFARLSLSLAGVVGVIAAALAAATIWLIMTQPVTVADAVAQGEVSPLVRALAGVLYDALQGLIKYLSAGPLNGPPYVARAFQARVTRSQRPAQKTAQRNPVHPFERRHAGAVMAARQHQQLMIDSMPSKLGNEHP